ncbi:MAG: YidC/Oxa1 family insertase periplasmic-domain containing protein [Phycisphaerales bacterium]
MKIWVTVLAILIGVAVVIGVMRDSSRTNEPAVETAPAAEVASTGDTPQAGGAEDAVSQPDAEADTPSETVQATPAPTQPDAATTAEPAVEPVAEQADAIPGLHAVIVDEVRPAVIGYDDPKSPFKMRVVFTRYGAGIYEISLADYLKTVGKPDHYVIHERLALPDPKDRTQLKTYEYAYAALEITVNGTTVSLKTNDAWLAGDVVTNDQISSVTYTATLADGANVPVLKIERTYTVKAGSYDLDLEQRVINLTDKPLSIRWAQNLQGDLVNDSGYLGDRRKYVSGYFALWWDAQKAGIYTQDAELVRSKIVGSKTANVWPHAAG